MLQKLVAIFNPSGITNRSLALDLLRGVAVLLVLFRHCAIRPEQAGALRPLAAALERFGWTGVDLFFVLSGFLVGGLLFKELKREGRLDVRTFLLLRLNNLSRPYDPFTHESPTHLRIDSLIWGVFIAYAYHFRHDLYLRLTSNRLLLLVLGILLISPMWVLDCEVPFVWTIGFTLLYIGYGLILMGLAPLPGETRQRETRQKEIAQRESEHSNAISARPGPPFLYRLIASIGFFSYSIYLWHANIGLATLSYYFGYRFSGYLPGPLHWCVGMSIYILIAFLTGIIMARLVELPFLALRDRMLPSRSGSITPP